LFSLIDRFISGEIKNKGRDKSLATLLNYKAVKNHLEKYQVQKKYNVDFDTIVLDFFYKYTHFLKHDLDLATNTIAKEIKFLKLFMGEAVDLGYTTNSAFRHKKFFYSTEETDSVYLDTGELQALYDHDLSSNKRLEEVRDLFVFGSCVGLRYSDYSDVQAENIVERNGKFQIHMITKKTTEQVIIPCRKLVLDIFKKYGNNFNKLPRSITIDKFDRYIKEACRFAGFREKGRLLSDLNKELCDCISSHTARRSFATNLFLEGFPPYLIMKVTGHKSEKSFLSYIKVSKLEAANKLEEHWKKFEWDLEKVTV
jgi:integrase